MTILVLIKFENSITFLRNFCFYAILGKNIRKIEAGFVGHGNGLIANYLGRILADL
jgi:hypothetical protein